MSDKLLSFSVGELIADQNRYCVPMYQRNYAWGEGEIYQLIEDVLDFGQKKQGSACKQSYYIGTLVVFIRTDGSFEVIDGQQRFTTLTLLAISLKRLAASGKISVAMDWFNQPNLTFDSREHSTYTLTRLMQGVALNTLNNEECNPDLLNGYALLEKRLLALGDRLNDFCHYLFEKVQITRVPVPRDTDLNHYFEVMNSRGEQLEKHEVVKARLMSVLHTIENSAERDASLNVLAKVWDAAANMERYIQYGFTPDERHRLFGKNDWGQFNPTDFSEVCQCLAGETNNGIERTTHGKTLGAILENSPEQIKKQNNDDQLPERFTSVINFSNFLLHVLRVWTGKDIPLDDKQLIKQFDAHVRTSAQSVKSFVFSLLKTKYLFDQYIIKREFSDRGDTWSLKRLHYYNGRSQSYINTFDTDVEGGFDGINRRILMLLSALHVSTPTLVYKHWLNGALAALCSMETVCSETYLLKLERLARQFIYGRYLNPYDSTEYYQMIYQNAGYPVLNGDNPAVSECLKYGKIESNLVFNYLDYLIWRNAVEEVHGTDEVIKKFEFTFRSSVEHFSPQHPIQGYTPLTGEALHRFGNLCLISHSKNSRLSNFPPKTKRDHFQVALDDKRIDSLKLYKMIKLMDKHNSWDEAQITQHELEMIELLLNDAAEGVTV